MPINVEGFLMPVISGLHGDLFLDIGANEGGWSMELSPRFLKGIAFEPVMDTFGILKRNIPENVVAIRIALGNVTGSMKINVYAEDNGYSHFGRAKRGCMRESVNVLRMDDIPFTQVLDFVKIDTEGFELPILMGAEETLMRHNPKMIIEAHGSQKECGEWLTGHGFTYCIHRYGTALTNAHYDELVWIETL